MCLPCLGTSSILGRHYSLVADFLRCSFDEIYSQFYCGSLFSRQSLQLETIKTHISNTRHHTKRFLFAVNAFCALFIQSLRGRHHPLIWEMWRLHCYLAGSHELLAALHSIGRSASVKYLPSCERDYFHFSAQSSRHQSTMPTGPGWRRRTSVETEKETFINAQASNNKKTRNNTKMRGENGTKDINFSVLVWLRARSEHTHTHTFCSFIRVEMKPISLMNVFYSVNSMWHLIGQRFLQF